MYSELDIYKRTFNSSGKMASRVRVKQLQANFIYTARSANLSSQQEVVIMRNSAKFEFGSTRSASGIYYEV